MDKNEAKKEISRLLQDVWDGCCSSSGELRNLKEDAYDLIDMLSAPRWNMEQIEGIAIDAKPYGACVDSHGMEPLKVVVFDELRQLLEPAAPSEKEDLSK